MRLFFHGLHIPETLPGLENPLPGPEGTVEVNREAREAPPMRGTASTQIERRRDEE